jgi:glycogen debranching enzyme
MVTTPEGDEAARCETAPSAAGDSRTRVLKQGDSFAVFNRYGDIVSGMDSAYGIYRHDTRFLSRFELRLNQHRPIALSSHMREDNASLRVDLANPDVIVPGGGLMRRELVHINRLIFLWGGAAYERLLVHNFALEPYALTLGIHFAADFADLFEVRGEKRNRRGSVSAERATAGLVVFRYLGLDGAERLTSLRFDPPPADLDTGSARFTLDLDAGQSVRLAVRIGCGDIGPETWSGKTFYRQLRSNRHALRVSSRRAVGVSGSNAVFNEMARRALADLYMLITETGHGPYPYAGIPWFSTPFGRDGIITAMLTLWIDPKIARGVLRFLAATQATAVDQVSDAEPGKILHEMREGEMARLGEVPFARYYGSVDATPLFVMLAGEYYRSTGDAETIRSLWPNIEAALRWIDNFGDVDGDGFVEYRRQSKDGLVNQGWKDSQDAISHADGSLAAGPIALCEVQAYVYAAKREAAGLAAMLGAPTTVERLTREAEALQNRFEEAYWCDELSSYALALDGKKQPCRVVASNAGHALLAGIASPEHAQRVAETLLGSGCFSGWGVRTLARSARRYNPISYHNGSVWPHDNALVALGLARYGLNDAALRVFSGMFDAATYMELRRLPELFCGFARQNGAPTLYPVACSPQAWASASLFGFLQASLGLQIDHVAGEIRLDRPTLPGFLDHLDLRGVRLGEASVDLRIHRYGDDVAVTVTGRNGELRVVAVH